MKNIKQIKQVKKTKIAIIVAVLLLLLIILFANRSKILNRNKMALNNYIVKINETTIDLSKVITNEPNIPVLGAGMIPIKWNKDTSMWQITTATDQEWYDYSKGICATVMLSDGYYKSELQVGITNEQLAENKVGVSVSDDQEHIGSIYTWVPRLMYKDNDIQYLKNKSIVEYEWTTPNCFTYTKQGANEYDLAVTGIWVSKETTTQSKVKTKIKEMDKEDNKYGLIKNETISIITQEERTVIEKLNQKIGNIENETTIKSPEEGKYKEIIKVLKTNEYSPIITRHEAFTATIVFKTIYKENKIKCVLDGEGKVLSTNESGNATCDVNENSEEYTFYVIDEVGNIKKHHFLYLPVGVPILTGFNPDNTFYVVYDEFGNEDSSIPVGEEKPEGWYDYEHQKWANIVVRNNGAESYFVWIPRYMYKLNEETQRSDVKFVDLESKYSDPETGKVINLSDQGYLLPDSFTWNGRPISGFWMSKYELGDSETLTITATVAGAANTIKVSDIINKTTKEIATYEVYLIKDGKRVTEGIDITNEYTFENLEYGTYTVHLIGKNAEGNQVAGMAKQVILREIEPPEVIGFKVDSTYIVTYDNDGNAEETQSIGDVLKEGAEIDENGVLVSGKIDVSKVAQGRTWYDYAKQIWPNIVTRNDGKEAYFVWIPRYEYMLDETNQRSKVILIPKSQTEPDAGYQISEAFTWNEQAISGYWMSKYELGGTDTSTLTFTAIGGVNSIGVGNIINKTEKTVASYEVYLAKQGVKVAGPISISDEYTFTDLEDGIYTVTLVGRDENGHQVLGMAQQVILREIEPSEVTGFKVDSTYIVTYDTDGNAEETQTLRSVLKEGAQIDENGALVSGQIDLNKITSGRTWYNYSKQIWPNIVTRNNDKEAYFVWIPRYEYLLDETRQRSKVLLIPKSQTEPDAGYQISEAFTWNEQAISGYWMSKYELST